MAGNHRARHYDVDYINDFIKTATDNGYLVSYNHPVWSLENEATILSYNGCFSLEIVNNEAYKGNSLDYSIALYQQILRHGKNMFCHGGDDNHNSIGDTSSSFGAWTMIISDELNYRSVICAMERGDMYASTGPTIYELYLEDGVAHIECSEAVKIHLYNGGRRLVTVKAAENGTLTSAELPLDDNAPFFFVSVFDKNGGIATTRGYFRDELK